MTCSKDSRYLCLPTENRLLPVPHLGTIPVIALSLNIGPIRRLRLRCFPPDSRSTGSPMVAFVKPSCSSRRDSKTSRSTTAPTYLSTTTQQSPAAGRKASQKKHASVYQTRTFAAPSAAAAPLAKGSRFGGSLAAHGERLATARVQLEEKVTDPRTIFSRPTVMRRYFPQLAAGRQDKPAVDELTMSLTDKLAIVDVWAGSAELAIPEVRAEELHSIAPLRVGGEFGFLAHALS
jgi:hypothetical protein